MHGLHNRYPEQENKMIAVSHKLLEQVKVVATEVDFNKHKLFDVQTGWSYASGMKAFIPHTWNW